MYKNQYIEKKGYHHVQFIGKVSVKELLVCMGELDQVYSNQKELRSLIDYRECQLVFDVNTVALDLSDITYFITNNISKYSLLKHAILTHPKADHTMHAFFKNFSKKITNYHFESFHDEDAAIKWLIL